MTRRTALGAAWSLPVIALAIAAPAAAASQALPRVTVSIAPDPVTAAGPFGPEGYYQADTTMTLKNESTVAVNDPVILTAIPLGAFLFAGAGVVPEWRPILTPGGGSFSGMIFSGGLAPGASSSVRIFFSAFSHQRPAATTFTWTVSGEATGEARTVTVLPPD